MRPPRTVTVVVPVLDDADQLHDCLTALAAQTRPADEVVVVDDGSTDASALVAARFGARVVSEPIRAIAAAAARGYDTATGSIIARVDSDSIVPVDWLERALPRFDDPRVAAVTGPGVARGLGPLAALFWRVAYMRAYFVLMAAALARPPLFGSNMLMRRSVWHAVRSRVHRDDPLVHDDVDLSVQLDPAWVVVLDLTLVVSVSGAPLHDLAGMLLRTRKAFRTLRLGGRRADPVRRAVRRLTAGPRTVPLRSADDVAPHRPRIPVIGPVDDEERTA